MWLHECVLLRWLFLIDWLLTPLLALGGNGLVPIDRLAECRPGLALRHYWPLRLTTTPTLAWTRMWAMTSCILLLLPLFLSLLSTLRTSCQGTPKSYQAPHFNSKLSSTWLQACHCPLRRGDNLTRLIGGGHSSLECALWPLCSLLLL